MNVLRADFTERHLVSLSHIPEEWLVGPGIFYELNLRMCQIDVLDYDFAWGRASRAKHSLLDQPERILQLDISLNDISTLNHSHLEPFTHLRVLNASLNRIERFVGIESLKLLLYLDLSHNKIRKLHGLRGCITLKVLNLSMNHLDDISAMPSLIQLRELHLSNNQLQSLDGIQALPSLKQLYVQRNLLTDIISLATSFRLHTLNAADNNIASLKQTVEVLQDLKKLRCLVLQGNPIDQEASYRSRLIATTQVNMLDNVTVRSEAKYEPVHSRSLNTLKETTRQAFLDHIAERRAIMEDNANFLQKRIQTLQKDFRDYELTALSDLESCLRYMDTLSLDEAEKYSSEFLSDRIPFGEHLLVVPKPHHKHKEDFPGIASRIAESKHPRGDYKDVKDTDEVLRCVYNELAGTREDLNEN